MNFENWFSSELSNIGHHFSIKVIEKLMLSNKSITKNFVRFHEILFQTDAESFSFLSGLFPLISLNMGVKNL